MSSSQNLEKTPSLQRKYVRKTFEKFGMQFTLETVEETRPEWRRTVFNAAGEEIDVNDPADLAAKLAKGERPQVEWLKTGKTVTNSWVQHVLYSDDEGNPPDNHQLAVYIYSTGDGPLLGILEEERTHEYVLLDPCVIQYDGKTSNISYSPIFNVARKLRLRKEAVRAISAPAEIIVASYPGFVIQNRMFQYQLKSKHPLEIIPEVDNDATEPVVAEIK